MKEYDVRYGALSNEVRGLEIRIPDRDLAACVVFVRAGPANEESSREHGISHKTEHAVFKGTEKRSERDWALAADNLGSVQGAYTEKEYTAFSIEVEASKAPKSMGLLAEALSKPSFPRGPMKLENGVLVGEISDYKDDHYSKVVELFESLLYGKTNMAKSILGTERSVRLQTRRDLKRYMGKWYRGENVLVVLAGKVNRMGKLVERYFGSIPAGPVHGYKGPVGYGEPDTRVITEATNQVHFILGVPGISMRDERYSALKVIEVVLGGHSVFDEEYTIPSSKLYELIRQRYGVAYDISAISYSGSEVGYFGIKGTVRPHLFTSTLELIRNEMFDFASTVTREEVARAKEFLNFYYLKKVESTIEVARLMGVPALMFGIVEQPKEILEKIEAVRLKDVRKVAGELFLREQSRLAVLGQFDKDLKRVPKSEL